MDFRRVFERSVYPKRKSICWINGSVGYKVGFVSPIYQYNNPSPTIVELLTYWIASSAHLVGTYKLPKVSSALGNVSFIDKNSYIILVSKGARACYVRYSSNRKTQ